DLRKPMIPLPKVEPVKLVTALDAVGKFVRDVVVANAVFVRLYAWSVHHPPSLNQNHILHIHLTQYGNPPSHTQPTNNALAHKSRFLSRCLSNLSRNSGVGIVLGI